MTVKKINSMDKENVRHLFMHNKFMGVGIKNHVTNKMISPASYLNKMYELFSYTYLSGLQNYHAFGKFAEDGTITTLISFYVSQEDASWYWTHIKNSGDPAAARECLDGVLAFNEANGYYKFYSMFPKKHENFYRRLIFSDYNKNRYDAVDEFFVKEKEQCKFNLAWQILYNRVLSPVETVVRLTYLKPEFRTLPNGGNL